MVFTKNYFLAGVASFLASLTSVFVVVVVSFFIVSTAGALVVSTAGAGVGAGAGAATESVLGAAVSALPPQEAKKRPIERATMLIFTNFMFVIFKSYFSFIPKRRKGNPMLLNIFYLNNKIAR
jgi:hypothetical protein